jgi:DNA-binding response OmpR family regulator
MRVIVASANIFRRELTSFVLDEAGYHVGEACDLAALLASISAEAPIAIVLDAQLEQLPFQARERVRRQTRVPILWLASPAVARPLLSGDELLSDALAWPYEPDDLRTRLARLLGQSAVEATVSPEHTRSIGGPE